MQTKEYQAGDVIYRPGESSDFAYVLKNGAVELRRGPAGAEKKVADVKTGDMFGEYGVIENDVRAEMAVATDKTTVELLTRDDFAKFYEESPAPIQTLIVSLFNKAHEYYQRSEEPAPKASAASATPGSPSMAAALEKFTESLVACAARLNPESGFSATTLVSGAVPTTVGAVRDVMTQDLGVIKPLIEDDSVNDILINRHDRIFVERKGKLEMSELAYADDAAVRDVALKIVSSIGRTLDPRRPLVDARLLDGSRVNIIAPPLAVDGTSISIRKFSKRKITLDIMKEQQNLSEPLAEVLKILGHCRINMLISGGTGSGKTTLLNAISHFIAEDERVVTIEDAAELQLQQPHVVRLETKPISSGASASEEVTMRDLVKNALRMRPDRIIVGEVRGPEAFDMMQAMNTGHDGSLTTIHANHPRDALARLENMISMANLNIPTRSIRQQIASALQVIVQISRMRDGKRRIMYVSEIVGVEGDTITMQDLFQFTAEKEDDAGILQGSFKWSGILPRFLRRIIYYGEGEHLSKALGVKLPKF